MAEAKGTNQTLIVTHAVLTGLTPLIPIPLLDDLVKAYFMRRLVRRLVVKHGRRLTEQDVHTLADDRSGCLLGCLGTALIYPLKKLFRKIFFFLEWKRAADTASRTIYHGHLLDDALGEGIIAPDGPRDALAVRNAIDQVLARFNTSPVERAARGTFRQSKTALRGAVKLLQRALGAITGKPTDERVAEAAEAVGAEEEKQVEGVVRRLQKALEEIPEEHFRLLRAELRLALGLPPDAP